MWASRSPSSQIRSAWRRRSPRCVRRSYPASRASTRRCTPPSSRASMRRPEQSGASSTGRFRSAARSAVSRRGQADPGRLSAQHRLADRLVFCEGHVSRFGGRLRMRGIGRRAPLEGDHRVLRRRSASASLRDTASPSARRPQRRTGPTSTGSARSASRCPGFEVKIAADGEIEVRSETVFQGYYKDAGGHGGGARTATAGSRPATSASSTRTASSTSPIARRTSSSPRAGRTSRRRTSRTT